MARIDPAPARPPLDDLVVDLDSAYADFRVCVARVLRSIAVDPTSGTSIAATLGINRQTAWRLATVVGESLCPIGLQTLPGDRGLAIFLRACVVHEADKGAIAALESAMKTLASAVAHHAGDRAFLELMTAAWAPDGLDRRTAALRRDGCRAQSALLGVNARHQIRGAIHGASRRGDPTRLSLASYQIFTDLVRLRRDRACRIFFLDAPTNDDGTLGIAIEDLPQHVRERYELDEELSSITGNDVEISTSGNRGIVTLAAGPLGRSASATIAFTGCTTWEPDRYLNRRNLIAQSAVSSLVPTETLYIDYLMPRSLAESKQLHKAVEVLCYDAALGLPELPATNDDPAFLFELESPEVVGMTDFTGDVDIPILAEVVDKAAQRIGHRLEDLVGVRFKCPYVMSPTSFIVSRKPPVAPD